MGENFTKKDNKVAYIKWINLKKLKLKNIFFFKLITKLNYYKNQFL